MYVAHVSEEIRRPNNVDSVPRGDKIGFVSNAIVTQSQLNSIIAEQTGAIGRKAVMEINTQPVDKNLWVI